MLKIDINISKYKKILAEIETLKKRGKIQKVVGLTIESEGPDVDIGQICLIRSAGRENEIIAEVVGFKGNRLLLMPLGDMDGIGPGAEVISTGKKLTVKVGRNLLGRVLDGLGNPIDRNSNLNYETEYGISNSPPNPLERKRIDTILSLGIKAIDGFMTCGLGQRMGIFSGSGVGKSTLIGMIARNTKADVNVIALIGERGREVLEFLEKDLGQEGINRSVVVVATSDQPALIRVKSAYVATAIAEYFRDQGLNVLLMMDSLTRFAMAQREVGLAIGEPPVSRGYTPSVFAVLPKLLERSGTSKKGSITGLYTVLVEGDDLDEPISDTVRGILDGHIVLSRKLANRNHYPPIDISNSISRLMADLVSDKHLKKANEIKELLSVYEEAEDLINIGAYKKGNNEKIDLALEKIDKITEFLKQGINEKMDYQETVELLMKI